MKTLTTVVVALFCCIAPILAQPPISENVTFLSSFNAYPEVGYNDIWGYTAPDNREYALLGVLDGTSIIDITDATQPVEVAFIPSDFSIWKDIKTYQNYAYVVNETGGGLQIIDLSDLPNSVTELQPYTGFPDAHNIYIDVASATLLQSPANPNEPCELISLADPENPVLISSFGGENHDAYAQNGRAFLSEGTQGSIGIFDISNPASPSLLERIMIPAAGYSHNVWATEDDNFIMSTEETTGKTVKFWDISDLGNINLVGEYLAPDGIAHNAHIKEGFAYISHYGSGLRIVDLTIPGNLTEAGFYDSFPNGGPGFVGNWGAYPFFDSGKVIISDRTFGLITLYFEGALSGEALDPLPPTAFTAFSDFNTPTSIELTWTDPPTLVDGTAIQSGDLQIDLFRNDTFLAQVNGGIESYTDTGLQDGQDYFYSIIATVLSSDSSSFPLRSRVFSGGSPIPAAPENLNYSATLTDVTLTWNDPTTQEDGTALDDLDSIRVYRDGLRIASVAAGVESYTDVAPANNAYTYRITALDSEPSRNESQLSDSVRAFIGDAPDYLVWIFDDTTQSALNSGDSLLAALQANGRDAVVSSNLFGFGSSLASYKAIFIVLLGGESDILTLQATDPETPALRDYLFNGGSLYAEGGATLQLGSRSGQSFDFRPWFGLQGNETATLFAFGIDFIEGLNSLGGLTYDYDFNFSVTVIEGLNPGSATELFRTTNTDSHILSVFNDTFGSGRSIATSFPFGAVQETGSGTKVELMSRYLDLLEPLTSIESDEPSELPATFALKQNYPNPFNPSTTISYRIGLKSAVKVDIYTITGQRVITLLDEEQNAGDYQITWDGKTADGNAASSGVYFYRLESETFNQTRKMILMK